FGRQLRKTKPICPPVASGGCWCFPGFAGAERAETLARHALFGKLGIEHLRRRIPAFVGELERAPMVAERIIGAREQKSVNSLIRVLVLVLHEPAWLVGAHRQDRGAEMAMA